MYPFTKHLLPCLALAGLALLGGASESRAAFGDFQYGTVVTPSPINPSSTTGGPGSQLSQAGIGNFTTPTAPTFNAAFPAGIDITVGTLNITDLAIGAYADTYGPTMITVDLKIQDVSSEATGTFMLTGSLSGKVSSNGTTGAAAFSNPFTAASTSQTIGSTMYTVSLVPSTAFTAPGAPPTGATGLNGVYSLHVQAGMPIATTITCPTDLTVPNAPGQCGAVVTYPAPMTTGMPGTVTCVPPSGSFFPLGATTVQCATTAGPSCHFTVTVLPTKAAKPHFSIAAINGVPIVGSPDQATVKVGDCLTLKLVLTTDGCPGTVDVTGLSTFLTSPARGTFTNNVWCATAADANHAFGLYGVFVNPFTQLSTTATGHVTVRP